MNEKEKVIDWIISGMNYNDGINLLVELTKKVDIGMYIGRERSMASKLAYEICKAAKVADHVTWKDFIKEMKVIKVETFVLPATLEPFISRLLKVNFDELELPDALSLIVGLKIEPVPESLNEMKDVLIVFMDSLKVAAEDDSNKLSGDIFYLTGTKLPEIVAGEEDKLRICLLYTSDAA